MGDENSNVEVVQEARRDIVFCADCRAHKKEWKQYHPSLDQ